MTATDLTPAWVDGGGDFTLTCADVALLYVVLHSERFTEQISVMNCTTGRSFLIFDSSSNRCGCGVGDDLVFYPMCPSSSEDWHASREADSGSFTVRAEPARHSMSCLSVLCH